MVTDIEKNRLRITDDELAEIERRVEKGWDGCELSADLVRGQDVPVLIAALRAERERSAELEGIVRGEDLPYPALECTDGVLHGKGEYLGVPWRIVCDHDGCELYFGNVLMCSFVGVRVDGGVQALSDETYKIMVALLWSVCRAERQRREGLVFAPGHKDKRITQLEAIIENGLDETTKALLTANRERITQLEAERDELRAEVAEARRREHNEAVAAKALREMLDEARGTLAALTKECPQCGADDLEMELKP